jgi:hypothetical protein
VYNAKEFRETFRIIDWMMHLRDDFSELFEQQLNDLEEELKMPYVTSVERIAEARGEARGQERGIAATIVRQLIRICGPLSDSLDQQIRHLPIEKLEALSDALLEFKSADDLATWLDSNTTAR